MSVRPAQSLDPEAKAKLYELVGDRRMIDAMKHLREQGLDAKSSKVMAERVNWELHPKEALAREKWLDELETRFGTPEE